MIPKKISVKNIKAPVAQEMKEFESFFRNSMRSKVRLLDIINQYIIKTKGKEIRPLLVFLSAKLIGNVNQSTFTAAALTQLLHTATLIHDDVVDEAYETERFLLYQCTMEIKSSCTDW